MKQFLSLTGLMALATVSTFAAAVCVTTPPNNNIIAGATGVINVTGAGDTYAPCTAGPLTFQNVSYDLDLGSFSSGTNTIPMSAITQVGSDVQLAFNPNLSAGSDVFLEFQMVGSIVGVDLGFNGSGSGFIHETVCKVFESATTPCAAANTLAILSATATHTTDIATFAAQPEVWVFKDISSGTAPFSEVDQSFLVPEPATLSLMGAGLLALGLLGRRRLLGK